MFSLGTPKKKPVDVLAAATDWLADAKATVCLSRDRTHPPLTVDKSPLDASRWLNSGRRPLVGRPSLLVAQRVTNYCIPQRLGRSFRSTNLSESMEHNSHERVSSNLFRITSHGREDCPSPRSAGLRDSDETGQHTSSKSKPSIFMKLNKKK